MRLIVWNSQGAKWDDLWDHFVSPTVTINNDDVFAFTVEAGWAPWMLSGNVDLGALYYMDDARENFNERGAVNSNFCMGIAASRTRRAFWVPWVKTLDAIKTNSRCSLGGVVIPYSGLSAKVSTINHESFLRPVVRSILMRNGMPVVTILAVHFISSGKAQAEMTRLVNAVKSMVWQGTSGIVVGDMNVNLLKKAVTLPDNWQLLNTGQPTQAKGGELDYALLLNNNNYFNNPTAQVIQPYHTYPNNSDHSVMEYVLPERR